MSKPVLHIVDILRWADAHHDRTGEWPKTKSGELFDAPDEKWRNIDQALRKGLRGFTGAIDGSRISIPPVNSCIGFCIVDVRRP